MVLFCSAKNDVVVFPPDFLLSGRSIKVIERRIFDNGNNESSLLLCGCRFRCCPERFCGCVVGNESSTPEQHTEERVRPVNANETNLQRLLLSSFGCIVCFVSTISVELKKERKKQHRDSLS